MISDDFLAGRIGELNNCISRLENEITTKENINNVYQEFGYTIRTKMKDKLRYKEICLTGARNNKRRRVKKNMVDNRTD